MAMRAPRLAAAHGAAPAWLGRRWLQERLSPAAAMLSWKFAVPSGYLPIFIFLVVALLFPLATIVVARLIRPSTPFATKLEAYECGIPQTGGSRGRHTIRFYLIAILFVIFDVETVFLFPWAVRYKQLGWFGVAEIGVFLVILVVGYVWAYKKGALEWV